MVIGQQETASQEPGGKQDQDTGDLFHIFTSLTRYPSSSGSAAYIFNVDVSTPAIVESYQITVAHLRFACSGDGDDDMFSPF